MDVNGVRVCERCPASWLYLARDTPTLGSVRFQAAGANLSPKKQHETAIATTQSPTVIVGITGDWKGIDDLKKRSQVAPPQKNLFAVNVPFSTCRLIR